ncbi:MAG: hypothetical protein WCK18_09990 [Prolixibacteraceae bacterium]
MVTYFIKILKSKGEIEEVKRKANSESEVEILVIKEFPGCEVLSIKTLLLD